MKTFKQYNESIRDKMIPKSEEEISISLDDLTPDKKMMKAIEYGLTDLVRSLIDDGIDMPQHVVDYYFYIANETGNIDILKMLLDNGADIHYDNDIILRRACTKKELDIIEFLIKRGANIHVQDDILFHVDVSEDEVINLLKKYDKK